MNKILVVIFVCIDCIFGVNLPPEIPICKRSDPNIKECLRSSAQIAIRVLANGYEDMKIPALDPLYLKEVSMEPVPGAINIYQKYTNIVIEGSSTGTINNFEVNLDDCSLWINHTLTTLNGTSDYVIKGQLLLLPVNAQGSFKIITDNFEVNIKAKCEKFKKSKVEYVRITSVDVKFKTTNMKFDFGVLIDGNLQLDKELHNVISDNPVEFFEVMRPSCEAIWEVGLLDIMNKIFMQIPLKELFP